MTELTNGRLDKWLWAARFYKTRQLAIDAINAGHVLVNDERVKPAKNIKVVDRILIKKPPYEFHLIVTGLSEKRGSATMAQMLYTETVASREAREILSAEIKQFPRSVFKGRPTKKDRRLMEKHTERVAQSEHNA
jgi:ribosome-associated heat shock protein Hsp15